MKKLLFIGVFLLALSCGKEYITPGDTYNPKEYIDTPRDTNQVVSDSLTQRRSR